LQISVLLKGEEMSEYKDLSQDEIRELEKWAKYGKLMSGFIHNLNTPLMGLSGRIELMEIKYPDVKGLEALTKHVDTLNRILQACAYFTDKDTNDKEYDTNIVDFIERFDLFMKSHMKYKHGIFVEKDLTPCQKVINAQRYFNALYRIISFFLNYTGEDDSLIFKNDENGLTVTFNKGDEDQYDLVMDDVKSALVDVLDSLESIKKSLEFELNGESIQVRISF